MSTPKHVVIFSHGFGVRKDSRGMFSEIVAALPECECVLFDYNVRDEAANTETIKPLADQAKVFEEVLKQTRLEYPNAIIDIVTHSQGAVAPALVHPAGIRKTILLAPPFSLDANRTASWFIGRPGSNLDFGGISRLARRDGSTTLVPAAYWAGLSSIDPIALYDFFAEQTELTIITAKQDELIRRLGERKLSDKIKVLDLDGDHNFTGEARAGLVETVVKLLD